MKSEILFGIHPVQEALRAARRDVQAVILAAGSKNHRLETIERQARQAGIRVETVSPDRLSTLALNPKHQGAVARVGPLPQYELLDFTTPAESGRAPFLVLLDQVLDPHNLGAIVRTALCAGVDGIVCPRDRAAAPTPVVSRISAGALEHVRLARVTNLVAAIKTLKKKQFWVAGTDIAGEQSVFDADFSGPLVVVIGGEGRGMRPLVRKQCDFLVSIPQANTLNSLNASVAGAVVMYAAFRQRYLSREGRS